jgi:methyltransferase
VFPAVVLAIAFISGQRLLELVLALRNEREALERGAREYGAGHRKVFFPVVLAWMAGTMVESLLRGGAPSNLWPAWAALWVFAFVLRWWSILSLGQFWMIRILLIPGASLVASGPYRLLRHPNYLAVMLEILSVPLLFGAPITAAAGTVIMGWLFLMVRIPIENRGLEEHAARGAA